MTPKEQYEARKAARKARQADSRYRDSTQAERDVEVMDLLDRLVTSVERIADALESSHA